MHSPAKITQRFERRITRYLDLSDKQSVEVDKIIRQNMSELESLRSEIRLKLLQQMEKIRTQIIPLLTPEQVDKLEKRFNRIEKNWLPSQTS